MMRIERWIFWIVLMTSVSAWGAAPIVFCMNPHTNQPGLTPMAMIGCDNTPMVALSKIAVGFAKLPQARRSLMLFGCLNMPPVFSSANIKIIVENGPDCTAEIRYLTLIFTQMKARNLVPARIVLDLEGSTSTWSLTPAIGSLSTMLMPIYNDAASFSKLPASLKQYSPSDFDNFSLTRGFKATVTWNSWQDVVVCQALRQTVSVTATKIFRVNIPATNYQDILPSFPVYDLNNWPLTPAAVGNESSPSLYLSVDGNRYISRQKDARWNHFIDSLNKVRSAIRNGPVVPWLGYPTYGGDSHLHSGSTWLWREQVKHLNAMGISQYLLFNPSGNTLLSDDQFASKVFLSMQLPARQPPKNYPPLSLDADSVTTGTVTTKYTDFLANLIGGAGAVMK